LGVESGRRFVEEYHGRVSDEAHRDVEPTTHAARVCRSPAVSRVGEIEASEQPVGDLTRFLEVAQLRDKHEVLATGEDLVDRRELAGQADRFTHIVRTRGDVEAVHRGGSSVGLEQRREDAHERRLASTIRAKEGEDASGPDLEVDST
jgi:hypothetical protein